MDGESCGLVQHEESGILVHDSVPHDGQKGVRNTGGSRLEGRRITQRRQPDFVFGCKAVIGLLALAIDPDLATPQQAIDAAARHALKLSQQEIVEPLACRCLAGQHLAHANRLISTRLHRVSLTC
jgi:hypothetical protein